MTTTGLEDPNQTPGTQPGGTNELYRGLTLTSGGDGDDLGDDVDDDDDDLDDDDDDDDDDDGDSEGSPA
jgi:hypothetical protein